METQRQDVPLTHKLVSLICRLVQVTHVRTTHNGYRSLRGSITI